MNNRYERKFVTQSVSEWLFWIGLAFVTVFGTRWALAVTEAAPNQICEMPQEGRFRNGVKFTPEKFEDFSRLVDSAGAKLDPRLYNCYNACLANGAKLVEADTTTGGPAVL